MRWDPIQNYQTHNDHNDQGRALSIQKTSYQQDSIHRDLQSQIDRLSLACQAMWEILSEQTQLTETQLLEKIEEIDARDGKIDKKISGEIISCPSCNNKTHTNNRYCIYCGNPIESKHTFKT